MSTCYKVRFAFLTPSDTLIYFYDKYASLSGHDGDTARDTGMCVCTRAFMSVNDKSESE